MTAGSATTAAESPSVSTSAEARRPPVDLDALTALAKGYADACGAPGAAVGVLRADALVSVVGVAGELSRGVPIAENSVYAAGSVTKLFVGVIAFQLISEGRLSLDTAVSEHLADWPRGDRITIEMLLSHRSGLPDYGNDFSDEMRVTVLTNPNRVFTYAEVLDRIRPLAPLFEPGDGYHYSNANTIVLGAIIQLIEGTALGEAMQRRIIEPLGLSHTFYGPDDLEATNALDLHGLHDISGQGQPVDIAGFPREAAITIDPAGAGLFSTVGDLARFADALYRTDRLLDRATRTRFADTVNVITNTELGVEEPFDVRGHGGVSPGAQTIVAHDRASGASVVVWCNAYDPRGVGALPSLIAAHDVLTLAVAT